VLYLVSFGILHKPALYLSDFFERHKGEYYDQLMAVRSTHKVEPWVRFFLLGIRETAALSIQVFKDVLALKERIEREQMPTFHVRRQANAQRLMQTLYQTPMVSIKAVAQLIQAQTNTAAALVDDFVKLEILQEFTGQKRSRLFVFHEYVRLFNR
jgi:Fic family protein